jgi:Aspartyl protease
VFIDFRHDLITIARSHGQPPGRGFMTVPFTLEHGRLLVAKVRIGAVEAKAIIDTGAQSTVANLALKEALRHWRPHSKGTPNTIEGVTADLQEGEDRVTPPIAFGPIEIRTQRMLFADARIFEYWKLTHEPALLIGMDALGLLDTLVIDYRRRELHLLMRRVG